MIVNELCPIYLQKETQNKSLRQQNGQGGGKTVTAKSSQAEKRFLVVQSLLNVLSELCLDRVRDQRQCERSDGLFGAHFRLISSFGLREQVRTL